MDVLQVAWSEGTWTHPPVSSQENEGGIVIEAHQQSDAWRETAYGFTHDSEHALLADLATEEAMEVTFEGSFNAQFDQAGLFVRIDQETWIKAGVESVDGLLQLGAVVTHGFSDWSVAPVAEWAGRPITIRASRSGNAMTIRARVNDEAWRLVRLCYWPEGVASKAGPFVAAPTRAGLRVTFTSWSRGPIDTSLHD